MEFHIAHEQVMKGKRKYLVPILLKGVNTGKIKDADLRMCIESHTYLDSTDKVCFRGHKIIFCKHHKVQ